MNIVGTFLNNAVISSALNATVLRNEIINNNIANNDVPDFKKKEVKFETYLNEAINNYKETEMLDLTSVIPTVQVNHEQYSMRIDGNNVDIEKEMVDLYQNSVKYDTLTEGVISNYKRLDTVINGIK